MTVENILNERYELASCRIRELKEERISAERFADYFCRMEEFLEQMITLKEEIDTGDYFLYTLDVLRKKNRALYADILPENYGQSYANPVYARHMLGDAYGPLLSFLYIELRGLIVYAFEQRTWDFVVCLELFLQVYGEFREVEIPNVSNLRAIVYWYVSDYSQEMIGEQIRGEIAGQDGYAKALIRRVDLQDLRYLYWFGEYVTEAEEKEAARWNFLREEEVWSVAQEVFRRYREVWEASGKRMDRKKGMRLSYSLGEERLIRCLLAQASQMGLTPIICRSAVHAANRGQQISRGYCGAVPNPQYLRDHREDDVLYLDEDLVARRLRATQEAFEKYRVQASQYAGTICVYSEALAEEVRVSDKSACVGGEKQQKLLSRMHHELEQIANRYLRERVDLSVRAEQL